MGGGGGGGVGCGGGSRSVLLRYLTSRDPETGVNLNAIH